MGKNFFIVVDMQNDFCTGALANKDAVAAIPRIRAELEKAIANGDSIIFTRDTHNSKYLHTGEGKHLPVPHCIGGTEGWQVVKELENAVKDYKDVSYIDKLHFGYPDWARYIHQGDHVTMVGTCTDICVISNSLIIKTIEDVEVDVIADCCAGLTPEKHAAALEVMASCQCNII